MNNSNNSKNDNTGKIQSRSETPVTFALMSVGSPYTKKQYSGKLKEFFDFLDLPGNSLDEQGQAFLALAKKQNEGGGDSNSDGGGSSNNNNEYWIEDAILSFLEHHKKRVDEGEIAVNTLGTFFWPIKSFCDTHSRNLPPSIDWKRLSKSIPDRTSYSNDRAPTLEEIRKVVEYRDRRIKPLVFVMCSSGIRLEAWIYLRWKHVEPIEDKKTGEIIAAKLTVYDGTPERYYTFISPEAYLALKNWMDYRDKHGEKITGESWLMRDLWRTVDVKMNNDNESTYIDDADESNNKNGHGGGRGGPTGFAKYPKRLSYAGVKKVLSRALSAQRIRNPLPKGERRYEWKASHGYRKFFETHAQEAMKLLHVEMLMGHDTGLQRSYYKPTEQQLLEDYCRAIPHLTINYDTDKTVLQKQVAELKEKSEQQFKEKESGDEETKKKLMEMQEQIKTLSKLVLKKSFQLIEKEVDANPIPYIEGADKMTTQEVLYEMQKRGVTTWEG